jgi:hypothetical protein
VWFITSSYSEDPGFKSQTADRLFFLRYIVLSLGCRGSSLNYVTSASLHVLFNVLFTNHPSIRCCIRGRVSKWVTNISKTAVMDVIGFVCVSLGSSTVQLHDRLWSRRACTCSEAGFSSLNGDCTWVYYQRAACCCAFLWAKRLHAKDIRKEIFPVYGEKCFWRKAVHNWVEKFSQGHSK